jgi:hypothetical protein
MTGDILICTKTGWMRDGVEPPNKEKIPGHHPVGAHQDPVKARDTKPGRAAWDGGKGWLTYIEEKELWGRNVMTN